MIDRLVREQAAIGRAIGLREGPEEAAPSIDPKLVAQSLLERLARVQAAVDEDNRRREQQSLWSAFLSVSWFPLEQYNSLRAEEAMYRKEQEKLSQVKVVVKVKPKQDKLGINWTQIKNKSVMWHPSVEEESWENVGRSTNALGARGSFHNLQLYFEANGYLVETVVCKMWGNHEIFRREGREICSEHVNHQEQVIDRQDTHEEHRLLRVVERMSMQHANLRWNSDFRRSSKEIHNCLTVVWCFWRVTPARRFTDHVMMLALATALEVPLRVERVRGGYDPDIYTVPGVPRPRVTLLYSANHQEIIYPRASQREHAADQGSNQQTSQRKHPADQSSNIHTADATGLIDQFGAKDETVFQQFTHITLPAL
uniref:Uncharacterized protein n=1 Tax=Aegilops tauschii TaxID=37682 RepID=M8B7F5_AEGTA